MKNVTNMLFIFVCFTPTLFACSDSGVSNKDQAGKIASNEAPQKTLKELGIEPLNDETLKDYTDQKLRQRADERPKHMSDVIGENKAYDKYDYSSTKDRIRARDQVYREYRSKMVTEEKKDFENDKDEKKKMERAESVTRWLRKYGEDR